MAMSPALLVACFGCATTIGFWLVVAVALSTSFRLSARAGASRGLVRGRERSHHGGVVDCHQSRDCADEQGSGLLTSSGLITYGTGPNPDLFPSADMALGLRELVLRLPAASWADGIEDGDRRKFAAAQRRRKQLEQNDFHEPELYRGLDVVIINDACFLKESFWNQDSPNFAPENGTGLNYKSAQVQTDVELVRPFFGKLGGGYCLDFASEKPGLLGGLGFEAHRLRQVSLWDALESTELKQHVLALQSGMPAVPPSDAGEADMSRQPAPDLSAMRGARTATSPSGGGNADKSTQRARVLSGVRGSGTRRARILSGLRGSGPKRRVLKLQSAGPAKSPSGGGSADKSTQRARVLSGLRGSGPTQRALELQNGGPATTTSAATGTGVSTQLAQDLGAVLGAADIVVVNGGNPEFLPFVLGTLPEKATSSPTPPVYCALVYNLSDWEGSFLVIPLP